MEGETLISTEILEKQAVENAETVANPVKVNSIFLVSAISFRFVFDLQIC